MGTKTRAVRTATTAKKTNILLGLISFMLGCITTATILLNAALPDSNPKDDMIILDYPPPAVERMAENNPALHPSSLQGIRILIIIAAYDFGQLPHLEEVLDSYQALCVTGAQTVDVIVHATVPYPVALIDLWNARLLPSCQGVFSFQIILKPSSLKLHLVDCHRPYFYEHLHQYDLFIYTEDDIRVTPLTVAAYLDETARIQRIKGDQASDFNVGIVRYEYNYPSNVVIDDKTRHATQNVTRVYWEHGQYPLFPKAMDAVPDKDLATTHVHMANHHQGMFLATQQLLRAWKDRKGCDFDKVRNRP